MNPALLITLLVGLVEVAKKIKEVIDDDSSVDWRIKHRAAAAIESLTEHAASVSKKQAEQLKL